MNPRTRTIAACHASVEAHRTGRFGNIAEYPPVGDEDLYGRLARNVPPEIVSRAAAEWDAMDERGRLPDGWGRPA